MTLDDPPNVVTLETTIDGSQIASLPAVAGGYYLGVIVDPLNQIRELSEVGRGPSTALSLIGRINNVPGLPPAGILSDASPAQNQFPTPAFAPLVSLNDFLFDATAGTQFINFPGGGTIIARGAHAQARAQGRSSRGVIGSDEERKPSANTDDADYADFHPEFPGFPIGEIGVICVRRRL